jgi:hypothetical protein
MKIPLEAIVQPQLEMVAAHDAARAALMPTNMSIRDAIAAVAIGRIKFLIASLLPRRSSPTAGRERNRFCEPRINLKITPITSALQIAGKANRKANKGS